MPKVPVKYDTYINIRFSSEDLSKLKDIAKKQNIKYNTLIRNILCDYIKSFDK